MRLIEISPPSGLWDVEQFRRCPVRTGGIQREDCRKLLEFNMLESMHATSVSTTPPAIIGSKPLIVTDDASIANCLQSWLASDYDCQAEFAPNLTQAARAVETGAFDGLFVDFRDATDHETMLLLDALPADSPNPLPLIAIDERNSRHELSGAVRKAVHGILHTPLDSFQLSTMLRDHLPTAIFKNEGAPPKPLVVKTPKYEYRTYCPQFYETLTHLRTVARHDVTILLVGETGTGKTTLARMVHETSNRSSEALLTVPCGALPGELIESELFGHVKGAFTGADRNKIGKFEAASRGSILLDEIDVLGPHQQAKLLRVIETGEYEPVGSHETRLSETRIIVATNEDLSTLMERNEFRSDLYYRLNVLEFHIPPLRKRPLDVIPLTLGFIAEFTTAHSIPIQKIHPEFLACLKNYHWPGNIRELKNHVRRAVLFCSNGELSPYDLAPNILRAGRQPTGQDPCVPKEPETLSEKVASSEQEILEQALQANDYKRTATAEALGISRVGLYKKMKKYGMLNQKRRID